MLYKMATFCSLDSTFKTIRAAIISTLLIASSLGLGSWALAKDLISQAPTESRPSANSDTKPLHVLLIPQWHLSPSTNTRRGKGDIPQAKNQNAIFKKLSAMIQKKELESVVFEGCQDDSLKRPGLKFNGWGLKDVTKKNAAKAQTHMGFRLLAKFPDLNAVCGDDLKLIEKNQLAVSDMRGLAGFKIRISSATGSSQKSYLEAAAKMLNMPPGSEVEAVITELNKEIKKSSETFTATIKERNKVFAEKVSKLSGNIAIVIGSLHIEDLKNQLTAKSIDFEMWIPEGLPSEGDNP